MLASACNSGFIDVFHGDADGISSMQQLHLHQPRPEALPITGAKREINLLARVEDACNCHIRVLDISLDSNRLALLRLLQQGNRIFYADHHFSGEIPASPLLDAHIVPSTRICTALIVDTILGGRFRAWAIVGAFGDNLDKEANSRALACGLDSEAIGCLRELGHLLNYNAYAMEEADQYTPSVTLYREAQDHVDPLSFARDSVLLHGLRQQYTEDLALLERNFVPIRSSSVGRAFLLPATPWSRRMSGPLANRMAHECPSLAHAVLVPRSDGQLLVSLRAPLAKPLGADTLCRRFPTGGGRSAAAGINALPMDQLEHFLDCFDQYFSSATQASELS